MSAPVSGSDGAHGTRGIPGVLRWGAGSRPPAPTARGRGRLAQCEPGATQSTPPRAMRAQGDEIHPRSIRASPPRTIRPEVTSPKRLPITRGVPPARCWHCLVGPHHTWGRPYPGRSTRCRQGRPSPRLGGDVVVRATGAAGGTPWESLPHRRARPAGGLVRRVCVYYALSPLLRLLTLHCTRKGGVAEGEKA